MNSKILRYVVGISAVVLLVLGGVLYTLGAKTESTLAFHGVCWRLGPVLLVWWLAWDYIKKLPDGSTIAVPVILVPLAVSRRSLWVTLPLAAVLVVLNLPWIRSRAKKRGGRK